MPSLSCSRRGLVPRPGIEPGPLELGAQSLSHWTRREVPQVCFKKKIRKITHAQGWPLWAAFGKCLSGSFSPSIYRIILFVINKKVWTPPRGIFNNLWLLSLLPFLSLASGLAPSPWFQAIFHPHLILTAIHKEALLCRWRNKRLRV